MKQKDDKRQTILKSAKSLIYRRGYHKTTLADIAEHSGITIGNIYYYFKTKKELVQAIVDDRTENFLALTQEWKKDPDPKKRLLSFLEMPSTIDDAISKHGCPVGSLLQELNKASDIEPNMINKTIQAHIDWVTDQYRLMGKKNANELGYNFIASLQGACLLANSMKNPEILHIQINRLKKALKKSEALD